MCLWSITAHKACQCHWQDGEDPQTPRRNRGIWRKTGICEKSVQGNCKDRIDNVEYSDELGGYCPKHKGERNETIARFEYMPWKELMEELEMVPEPKVYNLLLGAAKLLDDRTRFHEQKTFNSMDPVSQDWFVEMLSEHEGTKQWFETYGKNLHSFSNHVAMAFLSQASNGRELLIPGL